MLKPASQDSDDEGDHADAERQEPQTTGASTTSDPELLKLQVKQRAAIERFAEQQRKGSTNQYGFTQPSGNDGMRGVYADLQDLSFNDSSRTSVLFVYTIWSLVLVLTLDPEQEPTGTD